jgi:hypothetical protein
VLATDNEGNRVKASASSNVAITDLLPAVTLSATVTPNRLPEPGGMVEFALLISNQAVEDVSVLSLTSKQLGDLSGRGNCALLTGGLVLHGGGSYSCAFNAEVSGNAGETGMDSIRALATDDEGNQVEVSASVTVEFSDILPSIEVAKFANPDRLPEPGGMVQFTVWVTNQGGESVRMTALMDDSLGDLNGRGSCSLPLGGLVLEAGDSYTCTFEAEVLGSAGESWTNSVWVAALDDEGNQVEARSSAMVTIESEP